jgi:hypothetical protein
LDSAVRVALWLAVRRQRSTELDLLQKYDAYQLAAQVARQNEAEAGRAAAHAEHDARERRLTELYLKAVEQLGSSHAAVRHGGLYALERVAQDNPDQRRTIVDVACAYLRAPYSLLTTISSGPRLGVRRPLLASPESRRRLPGTQRAMEPGRSASEARQELEVRLAAQRILIKHLTPGDDRGRVRQTFWSNIDLNLTGAILFDFDFGRCRIRTGDFTEAHFTGDTRFCNATFEKFAVFTRSCFAGYAMFDQATFAAYAGFVDSHLRRHCRVSQSALRIRR